MLFLKMSSSKIVMSKLPYIYFCASIVNQNKSFVLMNEECKYILFKLCLRGKPQFFIRFAPQTGFEN